MTAQDVLNFATLDNHGYPKPLIKLYAFTSVGCYPMIYYTECGDALCADCATKEIRAWMYDENDDPPTMYDVYFEGADEVCAGCNTVIESAYGDPWTTEENNS